MPLDLNPERRVVVTGWGTVNPSGLDAKSSYANWIAGISGITTTIIGSPPHQTLELAGKIEGFDPSAFGLQKYKRTAKTGLYALAAAIEAANMAHLESIDPERKFVIIGSAIGGANAAAEIREKVITGQMLVPNTEDALIIPNLDANTPSAVVARYLKARAGEYTPAAACASGALPAKLARQEILEGEADIVIAGGSEASLIEVGYRGFHAWDALSPYIGTPKTASRPGDKSAKGFVIGEGAGVIVFERLSHAKQRGAEIYAELLGYGYVSAPEEKVDPQAESEARAMRKALIMSGLKPEDIDYINTHQAGTPAGDGKELEALHIALGEAAKKIPTSSTKSMIGHLIGGAGGVETIAGLMTLQNGTIHPNANLVDPIRDDFNLLKISLDKEVIIFMKNSFGLNGTYFCAIYGKYPDWERRLAA